MSLAIVTGSGGLIGSESVGHFVQAGYEVIGLENDMRAQVLRTRCVHRSHDGARWCAAIRDSFARSRSTYATPTASTAGLRRAGRRGGSGDPHRSAALP